MTRVAVIGNGMVGQRFLEELARRGEGLEVTAFCEEPRPAYDRVQLTSFLSGRTASDLSVVPAKFFQDNAMTLRLNDSVSSTVFKRISASSSMRSCGSSAMSYSCSRGFSSWSGS